jgi:hypothetical protein
MYLPLNLRRYPVYTVDYPLWVRWFEAKHEKWRPDIDAHLKDLEDEDVDYELQEEACA